MRHGRTAFALGGAQSDRQQGTKGCRYTMSEPMIIDRAAGQSGASGWTRAFKEHSSKIFAETLAQSVMLEASVLTGVVQGRERVQAILTAASGLYEALDFTRRTVDGDRTYMEWEARLGGGERVAGITVLTVDAAGKISAIAIHHRPLPGALRFSAELGRVLAGKIEPDLFHCCQ